MKNKDRRRKKEGLKPRNELLKKAAEYRNNLPLLSRAFTNKARKKVEHVSSGKSYKSFINGQVAQDQRKREEERQRERCVAPTATNSLRIN